MSNSEIPNTPAELFAMQAKAQAQVSGINCEPGDLNFWAETVDNLLDEEGVSPCQTVKIIEKLLTRLHYFHYEVIKNEDLNEYQRDIWVEDQKILGKALRLIRQIDTEE